MYDRRQPELLVRRVPWFFILPTIAALLWQVASALRDGRVSSYRWAALAVGAAVLVWGARSQRKERVLPGRFLACAAASALFWLSALEATLVRTQLLVLGLLFFAAAALTHATALAAATRASGGESRPGRVILGLGVSLSVCALLLCGVEGIYRAAIGLHTYDAVSDDPGVGHYLVPSDDPGRFVPRPGYRGRYVHPDFRGVRVEINDSGLRDDPDEAGPPAPDELSVLVLGDSFAFGMGVSLADSFQERLEARGAEITPRSLRVYGGGVPGYGALHERQRLAELAPWTRPDVVIVAVFEGNDFQDNWWAEEQARERASDGGEPAD